MTIHIVGTSHISSVINNTTMCLMSVIICTHDPRPEYIKRTLLGLKNQSLPTDKWEIVLIDNRSTVPLNQLIDVSWHPSAHYVREEVLGLTPARLRGILEAHAELLVFVDDDNYLEEHYLSILLDRMQTIPLIGALGAGRIIPEFEVQPSPEITPFLQMLALREESRAHYSNEVKWHKAIPYGAGLCIRRTIAYAYVQSCKTRIGSIALDRKGDALLSGGDIDLALHACKDNYLVGVIPELELIHLIPASRLELTYIINIAAGHAKSHYILSKLWKYRPEHPENPISKFFRYWKRRIQAKGVSRTIFIAEQKAIKEVRSKWSVN